MFYIVFALLLFVASVIIHIFFCRKTSRPGLHAKAFCLTSMGLLGIYGVVVVLLPYAGVLDPHSLWGTPFRISAALIFILLVPIYLCFYVLTQLTSPSKTILLTLAERGKLSRTDILARVEEENFITTRLSDLCTSGCVVQMDGRYVLTAEGRKIAAMLDFMQWALGRNLGG